MISKKINDITIFDIEDLLSNCICEGKQIEYKRELHIDTSDEKKEFLADLTSFANSIGGDLIFGIEEDSELKVPKEIIGIDYENEDVLIRRIEDLLRDTIQPRIINIDFRVIPFKEKLCILVIRINHSILSPHRIEFRGSNQFYTRNTKGKYQMDVSELRSAFNSSMDISNKIEDYKLKRISELIANRYNELENNYPILALHFIPLSSFQNIGHYPIEEIQTAMKSVSSSAFNMGFRHLITVDGIDIKDSNIRGENKRSKSALARYKINGIVEKATTNCFNPEFTSTNVSPSVTLKLIYSHEIFQAIVSSFNEVIKYYKSLAISMPIIVSCSILNGRGYTIPTKDFLDTLNEIDRDILFLPNIILEDLDVKTEEILQPIFDAVWNSCGYEKCPAYDNDNNFIGLR